jgi:predicted nuclease with TOPRIM domain
MAEKPTYEELEQRVKELEKENTALKRAEEVLQGSKENMILKVNNIEVERSLVWTR